MKILFLNQFFWPDSSATSQQLTDLAVGLSERGHDVHVICSQGGYHKDEGAVAAPPVTIHRVATTPFVKGRVGRALSYMSYLLTATLRACTLPKFDAVVTLTTPPLISLAGSCTKLLRGSKHYIAEHDIYPDVAVSLGVIRAGGLVDRVTGGLADASRRYANGVMVLGPCMKERLVARGIPEDHISVTVNWANASAIRPMNRPGDPSKLVLLYSGNLGLAHDLDTLLSAVNVLRHDERFHFIFVGAGNKREMLNEFVKEHDITNVEQRGYVPRDQLSEGLAIGDVGIVLQTTASWGTIIPSKMYGIMAAGRPVLLVGPADGTAAITIAEHACGWRIDNGDVKGLVDLLQHLSAHPEEVRAAGARAREALLNHYDMPLGVARVARVLEPEGSTDLVGTGSAKGSGPRDLIAGNPIGKAA